MTSTTTQGHTMITSVELTEASTEKFNIWFASVAKPAVQMQAVLFEMLDQLQELASTKQSLVYELGHQYTNTGRPELFRLELNEVEITQENDE